MAKKKLSKRLSSRAPWLAAWQARFGHAPGIQEVGEALRRQDLLLQRDLADRLAGPIRSEEHTSELQSLAYLVCRLLLEKKKKKNKLRNKVDASRTEILRRGVTYAL